MPTVLVPTLFTVQVTAGLVLVLGFLAHVVTCLATGRLRTEPLPPEADAPRARGGISVGNTIARGTHRPTIANSAPTGREMRKRFW